MSPRIFPSPAPATVLRLLGEAKLPVTDLTERHMQHFFGCGTEVATRGVVGLELHGDDALLRSLAVDPQTRGRGCAKALVARAESHAREQGARRVYLLTTTAADFFAHLGYKRIDRDRAPESIRATGEFSTLCPVSSVLMTKEL